MLELKEYRFWNQIWVQIQTATFLLSYVEYISNLSKSQVLLLKMRVYDGRYPVAISFFFVKIMLMFIRSELNFYLGVLILAACGRCCQCEYLLTSVFLLLGT